LDDFPELSESVIVYSFTDFEAPTDRYSAATQAVTFTIDPSRTTVLTYGFNGSSWDEDTGWRQYDYFVPNGARPETDVKVLVVLGDDIGGYTLAGYENGACETEIDGVSCTVTRTVTTLDTVLDRLCRAYAAEYGSSRAVEQENAFDAVPMALFQRAVADLLTRYGVLSGDSMTDRYSDGRLDDVIAESLTQDRVLYLAFPVTVPADGSASVSLSFWKAPSFDFSCSQSESVGLQGYDLVTTLGSTLNLTAQTAVLANTDNIEIVRQNLGFDLDAGSNTVALDPAQVYYYLEIREKS
jgi:hypothetical protein